MYTHTHVYIYTYIHTHSLTHTHFLYCRGTSNSKDSEASESMHTQAHCNTLCTVCYNAYTSTLQYTAHSVLQCIHKHTAINCVQCMTMHIQAHCNTPCTAYYNAYASTLQYNVHRVLQCIHKHTGTSISTRNAHSVLQCACVYAVCLCVCIAGMSYVQPLADRVGTESWDYFWNFVNVPESCPRYLQLVPSDNMVLIKNPIRILVRLVPYLKFVVTISRF